MMRLRASGSELSRFVVPTGDNNALPLSYVFYKFLDKLKKNIKDICTLILYLNQMLSST
jgi:hypothetical protein